MDKATQSTEAGVACTFDHAIVRTPSRSIVDGLRAGGGEGPDHDRTLLQHGLYVEALRESGLHVTVLPALEPFPDSTFVEDPAFVFGDTAVLLRSGAPSRLGETEAMADDLRRHFATVVELPGDGHVDGGDLLLLGDAVLIGLSERTDPAGAEALTQVLATVGLEGRVVQTPPDVLHFKSDCSPLGDRTVLSTRRLTASGVFDGCDVVEVPEGEEAAANSLRLNDTVLLSAGFPNTAALLESLGYRVVLIPTDEVQKVDAGLSCMSLRWRRRE